MSRTGKIIIAVFIAAGLMIIASQLDFIIKDLTRPASIAQFVRFTNFLGNGLFLIGISAAVFLGGWYSKKGVFSDSGKLGVYAVALASVMVHLLKAAFERPRIAHTDGALLELLQNPSFFDLTGKYNSFPSGHTAVSFAVAYVFSKKFPKYSPLFYLLAFLVGFSRVYLGSHYPTDIVGGAFIGLWAGWLLCFTGDKKKAWIASGFALLTIFMVFFKSGSFFLFDVDEAVFSEATREMVETGDYITPTYNYEPRYDKPILIYWFMSAAFKLFGASEFSARFTSAGFAALLVLMAFGFVNRLKGFKAALIVSAVLLLNIQFFVYSHSAVTDMTLAFFISGALFSFFLGTHEKDRRWFLAYWVFAALATLTKGVIGILFPVAIGFLYLLASRQLNEIKNILRPVYIIVFIAITAPWFIIEFSINGMEFFNAFIVKHHIKRYSDVISSHSGPFYFYIGVLLLGFFPWVSALPNAIYNGFKERKSSGLYLFSGIWFLFVLIFFSIAKTKLPNYIFPLYPAGALLAGLYFSGFIEGAEKKHGVYIASLLSFILAIALFIVPSLGLRMDIHYPPAFFYAFGAFFLITGLFALLHLASPMRSFIGACATMALMIVFLRLYALPPASEFLQKPLYDYSAFAKSLGPEWRLATYGINKPSVAFYAAQKVIKIEKNNTCDITEYGKRSKLLVITTSGKAQDLADFKELKVIDARGGYVLLGNAEAPSLK